MTNSISGLGFPQPPAAPREPLAASPLSSSTETKPFNQLLFDSLKQVDALQEGAQSAVEKGLSGGDITQVEVLTSMKKADLALKLMVQIRNKVYDAYTEIQQLRM